VDSSFIYSTPVYFSTLNTSTWGMSNATIRAALYARLGSNMEKYISFLKQNWVIVNNHPVALHPDPLVGAAYLFLAETCIATLAEPEDATLARMLVDAYSDNYFMMDPQAVRITFLDILFTAGHVDAAVDAVIAANSMLISMAMHPRNGEFFRMTLQKAVPLVTSTDQAADFGLESDFKYEANLRKFKSKISNAYTLAEESFAATVVNVDLDISDEEGDEGEDGL
jgi:hypothetical protein